MADQRALYARLGISQDADERLIKSAFRRQAREHHPDLNPGDAGAKERFILIAYAFEVLSDPARRALYDEFGERALVDGFDVELERRVAQAAAPEQPWWRTATREPKRSWRPSTSPSFAQRHAAQREEEDPFPPVLDALNDEDPFTGSVLDELLSTRGEDVTRSVELDFELAVTGGAITLIHEGASLVVRIPSGIEPHESLLLEGHGAPSPDGGVAGDLHLIVEVREHPWLKRAGLDLEATLPITMPEAILGARINLPTPHGLCVMTLPEGTHSGARLRLRQMGVRRGERQGDLYVTVFIQAPQRLDEDTLRAAELLTKSYPKPVRDF